MCAREEREGGRERKWEGVCEGDGDGDGGNVVD